MDDLARFRGIGTNLMVVLYDLGENINKIKKYCWEEGGGGHHFGIEIFF